MKWIFFTVVIGLFSIKESLAKKSAPKVQVYSRTPGEYGKENILICHVNEFYPPEINIVLTKNGEEILQAEQSDLSFENNWFYHLTKHVPFTPNKGEEYGCRVTHLGKTHTYIWESDM